MTNIQDLADVVDEMGHRHLMSCLSADKELRLTFQTKGLSLTYGELRSFDIARYQGVSAEQFASLPTREERMSWLEDRMKLLRCDINHLRASNNENS